MIDHLRIRQVATFLSTLKPLSRKFFNRDPRVVGSALLGKVLVRRTGRQLLAARIVEVEAYLGTEDLAAHAAAGRTARNAVLFGPPGARLCVLHLRQPLLPEYFLPAGWRARLHPDSLSRTAHWS